MHEMSREQLSIMLMNPVVLVLLGALAGVIFTMVVRVIRDALKPRPDTRVYVQQISDGLVISATNLGKATDRVKIEVSTIPYTITDYRVKAGGRIRLIQGGPVGNYAIFMIDELQPDTHQAIILVTEADKVDRISAWSEYIGDLKKVSKSRTPKITIEFGPVESYEEWQRKQ